MSDRYKNVDWNLTDRQIAKQLGITYQAVNIARNKRGHEREYKHKSKRNEEAYKKLDALDVQSFTLGELSEKTKLSKPTIWKYLKSQNRSAKYEQNGKVQPKRVFDFSNVDWSKSNEQIALELGCKHSYVTSVRYKLAKPDYKGSLSPNGLAARKTYKRRNADIHEKILDFCKTPHSSNEVLAHIKVKNKRHLAHLANKGLLEKYFDSSKGLFMYRTKENV